jgi:hypothetical protein
MIVDGWIDRQIDNNYIIYNYYHIKVNACIKIK